ncbi:calcium uptake protein, mitochondrial isoform X2 [Arachis hypogaea]|uniref:Uncharacterized protein n=1 Tax=Arachis hypogaea TaxID=3818 RepID=A0A444Z5E3_ARAHY|nr:calcium uptake protein, mitochondrial isoform X2 [Arachis hypogaea]RYR09412.1 hypothetical protein Ahy_B05g077730 isoform A [Arachis hypogaea]
MIPSPPPFISLPPLPPSFLRRPSPAGVMNGDQASSRRKKLRLFQRDSYRRRVFFNYEKRIRLQSPPEKVFEYFASIKIANGKVYMTPVDLMRAVVPVFPPSESNRVREGFLRGEQVLGTLRC